MVLPPTADPLHPQATHASSHTGAGWLSGPAVLALLVTGSAATIFVLPALLAAPAGASAPITALHWAVFAIAALGATGVEVIRFRALFRQPCQSAGQRFVEATWTALPAVLLTVLFVLTLVAMTAPGLPADAEMGQP